MKIYFYDGYIADDNLFKDLTNLIPEKVNYIIDAGYGPNANLSMLQRINQAKPNVTILTNSILAFNTQYGWDNKKDHPDIYLYVESKKKFIRIDKLTDREIRYAHNIGTMYLAGEFNED